MARRWPIARLAFVRRPGAAAAPGHAPDKFRDQILAHLDAAWNYARYLCRDADLAEDLVQEAFLRAFRAQGGPRGDGKAWLMTIVRNCWHDWLSTHAARNDVDAATQAEPVDAETPHTLLERQGAIVQLRAVLAKLPEPFRETLVLRELEELSYREIGEVTGVPIGTVMSRLARGRTMLAAVMLGTQAPELPGAMKA